ncbi:hypothetical protein CIB48_g4197 [Xylaria polymorpha]|nr:hypothetical protein CIB48_g4197 [Xylaria polymorpha]
MKSVAAGALALAAGAAALSGTATTTALFAPNGATWCGSGCGQCYQLTSTGHSPCSTCGTGGANGQSIVVMVTYLCPFNGNQQWCPQPGGRNQYGYEYHFDIMAKNQVFGDNTVVNFKSVPRPSAASNDFRQCVCA